jgi:hypothetical protein
MTVKTPQVTPAYKTGIYIGNGTVAAKSPKSFKPMFHFGSNEIKGNAQCFGSYAEAEASAQARFRNWTMPTDYSVEESDEPVNYRWTKENGDETINR